MTAVGLTAVSQRQSKGGPSGLKSEMERTAGGLSSFLMSFLFCIPTRVLSFLEPDSDDRG